MVVKVVDNEATCLRLKALLEKRGLSPKEVQNALHLESVQAVYKWLNPNNKSMPSLDNLVQLAHILNCAMEDILVIHDRDL